MRHLVPYLLSVFPIIVFGQLKVYNKDLVDTNKPQLYQFISNHLVIDAPFLSTEFKLRSSNSSVRRIAKNQFELIPYIKGNDTLRVYSTGKIIQTIIFKVDTLSSPIVRVGNLLDTILSLNQIILNPVLNVLFPGSIYKSNWHVSSFTLIVKSRDYDLELREKGNFNRFSSKQIAILNELHAGDVISFDEIYGGGPDSRSVKFPSFRITIK